MTHEYSSHDIAHLHGTAVGPATGAFAVRFHTVRFAGFIAIPLLALRLYSNCNADVAAAKLIVWSLAAEICGFATMSGPLGANHSLGTALWFRLTPGTLKQPLVHGLPRLRSCLDRALFCAYVASLAAALYASGAGQLTTRLRISACLLTVLCILDRSAYSGSKGDYYWTLLVCVAYAGVGDAGGVTAMQLVQIAHLLIPGVAKLGPWFAHVLPFFLAISPLVPSSSLRTALYTPAAARIMWSSPERPSRGSPHVVDAPDAPVDVAARVPQHAPSLTTRHRFAGRQPTDKGDERPNEPSDEREAFVAGMVHLCPSATAKMIGWLAACTEVIIPLLWFSQRSSIIGVALSCGMHAGICVMLPPGAVLEWNATNAALELYLFGGCPHIVAHGLPATLGGLCIPLQAFVALVAWVGPICGHIWPDAVSNTFACRKCVARGSPHGILA